MGESSSSDSWKKLVIAKSNDQWVSMSSVKREQVEGTTATNFSLDYDQTSYDNFVKTESLDVSRSPELEVNMSVSSQDITDSDPLLVENKKKECPDGRAARLSKMSAYAAQRLANETSEQRASRLKRMSEYAARRLANETREQRAKRLARMSAYAARRLAQETPEQRSARLARMSAYAAKRHAMKKMTDAMNKTSASDDKLIM